MTAQQVILAGGIFNLLFAAFHVLFWRIFRWREVLALLDPVNRAIVQILNLCLTFVFLVFAGLSIFFTDAMVTTALGHALVLAIGTFWLLRAVEQIVFYGLRHAISVALFVVFLVGAGLYASGAWLSFHAAGA